KVENEPILEFRPGSAERKAVEEAVREMKAKTEEIPCIVNGEEIYTGNTKYQVSPFEHSCKIARFHLADEALINKAIKNSMEVRVEWERTPFEHRASILLKAADLISTCYRGKILASTMLGQAKNIQQAEIDATCELIDFFRFNVKYAKEIYQSQPDHPVAKHTLNALSYRGLEGFVAAISPFNFTAIGANLCTAPALMGNVVVWKPSDTAMLSNYFVYKILQECGLPDGVINFVPADGPTFGDTVVKSKDLAAINFTGSVPTFRRLWKQVAENLETYRNFPRLIGECGGKNYHFVHSSANIDSVINGTIRSAFEYGGQKCSACSRMYVPDSKWDEIKSKLLQECKGVKVGPADEFATFVSAVIDDKAFDRIKGYIDHAKSSPNLEIIYGGSYDNSKGYYINPTVVVTKDPHDKIIKEEIFGPVLTIYVYPDDKIEETLKLVSDSTAFALTGAIYGEDRKFVQKAMAALRDSAGNFYINDKSTGSVVGQQPFGGSRLSGTNDKAGMSTYLLKWASPQSIKESLVPLRSIKYPSNEP
ncbi:uncharacterized protein TRIADDRAFT_26837, partial [Trichoplax adhaerens]